MTNQFKPLLDALEAREEFVTRCADDMIDSMEKYLTRLEALIRPFRTMPAEDLNRLLAWGFVPRAKVRYDACADELVFVGYTELMRMQFRRPDGTDTYGSVEVAAKTLEHFTLLAQGAEIPPPAPEKTGLDAWNHEEQDLEGGR